MDVGSDGVVLACDGAFEVGCFYDVLVHDAARRFAFEKSRGVSVGGGGSLALTRRSRRDALLL